MRVQGRPTQWCKGIWAGTHVHSMVTAQDNIRHAAFAVSAVRECLVEPRPLASSIPRAHGGQACFKTFFGNAQQ